MKLRVLIADDEPLSRDRLRQFLQAEPGTEIVAECGTGLQALGAIRRQSPDLVFLDVKMPDLDGFDVLKALNGSPLPVVIFVTAHDQFALRAFEMHAVDYLLKPFDRERFRTALQRACQRLQNAALTLETGSLSRLLSSLSERVKPLERVMIKSQSRITVVPVTEIDWICAADNYAELHIGTVSHFLRKTVTTLADELPQNRFIRISRSVLVNSDRIREIRPRSHGDYLVTLHNGTRLTGSRNYRRGLSQLLGHSR